MTRTERIAHTFDRADGPLADWCIVERAGRDGAETTWHWQRRTDRTNAPAPASHPDANFHRDGDLPAPDFAAPPPRIFLPVPVLLTPPAGLDDAP